MEGSGQFEVVESGAQVVTGKITVPTDDEPAKLTAGLSPGSEDAGQDSFIQLTSSDIYKELRLRGYDYGPSFQGIISASNIGKCFCYVIESK